MVKTYVESPGGGYDFSVDPVWFGSKTKLNQMKGTGHQNDPLKEKEKQAKETLREHHQQEREELKQQQQQERKQQTEMFKRRRARLNSSRKF